MATAPVSREIRATTVRLPVPVYDQAKSYVTNAARSSTISLNDFFVCAIQAYLRLQKRREIDAAFARMSEDADYQKETQLLSEEFESSDWETLGLSELAE
jgi:hypothetical protein